MKIRIKGSAAVIDELSNTLENKKIENEALKEKCKDQTDELQKLRKLNSRRITQNDIELHKEKDRVATEFHLNRQVDESYTKLQLKHAALNDEAQLLKMQNAILERQLNLAEDQARDTAKDAMKFSVDLATAESKLKIQEKSFNTIHQVEVEAEQLAEEVVQLQMKAEVDAGIRRSIGVKRFRELLWKMSGGTNLKGVMASWMRRMHAWHGQAATREKILKRAKIGIHNFMNRRILWSLEAWRTNRIKATHAEVSKVSGLDTRHTPFKPDSIPNTSP